MKKLYLFKSVLFLALIFEGIAVAEERVTDFGSSTPTKDELIKALTPPAQPPQIKMRGINVKRTSEAETVITKTPIPNPAVNLSLTFGFDAATLTEETKTSLNALGEALKDPALSSSKYRIEGHTDAVGGEKYNKNLSKRRADSVKKYLANNYGVSPDRLVIVGKGEKDLLDWDNPGSSSNRRVKIVNLGSVK